MSSWWPFLFKQPQHAIDRDSLEHTCTSARTYEHAHAHTPKLQDEDTVFV